MKAANGAMRAAAGPMPPEGIPAAGSGCASAREASVFSVGHEGRVDATTDPASPRKFLVQGLTMRSASALPTACVRLSTFSLRRVFCTWFFTVSGLMSRMMPISMLLLPW